MRTKKVKPPKKKYEYVLEISRKFDEIKQKDYINFRFQTTKPFVTYQYILKVNTEVTDSKIAFNIVGFTAPVGELSNFGFAGHEFRLYDPHYKLYNVTVTRKDDKLTKFKMNITKSTKTPIKLLRIPKETFIQITTEIDTQTF
jgi:hypothetical protein